MLRKTKENKRKILYVVEHNKDTQHNEDIKVLGWYSEGESNP